MPVMYDAQVFLRFFSTNKDLGLAYLPKDAQIAQVKENRSIPLRASLCFVLYNDLSQNLEELKDDCLILKNQSAAWHEEAQSGYGEKL